MFGAAVREGGLLPPGPHHSQCDLHQVGALVQGNPGSAAKAGTQPSPAQPSPARAAAHQFIASEGNLGHLLNFVELGHEVMIFRLG